MKPANFLLLLVVLGAVAASILLFRQGSSETAVAQRPDAPTAPASADGSATATRPAASVARDGGVVDPARVALENGASLMTALTTNAVDGRIESEAQANLVFLATNCHEAPDMTPVQSDGFEFDETRAWAIARYIEICAGYDPDRFEIAVARPDLMGSMQVNGWVGTETMATEALESSGIMLDVFTAGQLMMENDAFPFDEVLPAMQQNYGPQEITTAWLRASMLATCDTAGGCGKNSLEVIQNCANLGCREGLDLIQVLEQRLPPSDYRATMAMYSWLNRRRSSR